MNPEKDAWQVSEGGVGSVSSACLPGSFLTTPPSRWPLLS